MVQRISTQMGGTGVDNTGILHVDRTNVRVGVGTVTPAANLHVTGNTFSTSISTNDFTVGDLNITGSTVISDSGFVYFDNDAVWTLGTGIFGFASLDAERLFVQPKQDHNMAAVFHAPSFTFSNTIIGAGSNTYSQNAYFYSGFIGNDTNNTTFWVNTLGEGYFANNLSSDGNVTIGNNINIGGNVNPTNNLTSNFGNEASRWGTVYANKGRVNITSNNQGYFNLDVAQNFTCVVSEDITINFTNISNAIGQSGWIELINTSANNISIDGNIKTSSLTLSSGITLLSYLSNGTAVYLTAAKDMV